MKNNKRAIYLTMFVGATTVSLFRYFPPLLYTITILIVSFGVLYSTIWSIRHKKILALSVLLVCISVASFSLSALKLIENYFPVYQNYIATLDMISSIGFITGIASAIIGLLRHGDEGLKRLAKWAIVLFVFIGILYWVTTR